MMFWEAGEPGSVGVQFWFCTSHAADEDEEHEASCEQTYQFHGRCVRLANEYSLSPCQF